MGSYKSNMAVKYVIQAFIGQMNDDVSAIDPMKCLISKSKIPT